MYRAIAIASGALALAACSSINLDFLKPAPAMDTVQFESEPPGAEAKVSNGQSCRTPCALALQASTGYTVTFTLNGYTPATETLELVAMGDGTNHLRPNPVSVELTPAAPPPKPKKPAAKKPVAKKPAAAKPAPKPTAAAPPAAAPPPQPGAPSPWPPAQPQR
jgi:hypothetical protein